MYSTIALFMSMRYSVLSLRRSAEGRRQEGNIKIVLQRSENRYIQSLKYELIYIQTFNDGKHLTEEVKKWFNWYKGERPHQALEYQTPDEVYRKNLK